MLKTLISETGAEFAKAEADLMSAISNHEFRQIMEEEAYDKRASALKKYNRAKLAYQIDQVKGWFIDAYQSVQRFASRK